MPFFAREHFTVNGLRTGVIGVFLIAESCATSWRVPLEQLSEVKTVAVVHSSEYHPGENSGPESSSFDSLVVKLVADSLRSNFKLKVVDLRNTPDLVVAIQQVRTQGMTLSMSRPPRTEWVYQIRYFSRDSVVIGEYRERDQTILRSDSPEPLAGKLAEDIRNAFREK